MATILTKWGKKWGFWSPIVKKVRYSPAIRWSPTISRAVIGANSSSVSMIFQGWEVKTPLDSLSLLYMDMQTSEERGKMVSPSYRSASAQAGKYENKLSSCTMGTSYLHVRWGNRIFMYDGGTVKSEGRCSQVSLHKPFLFKWKIFLNGVSEN